MTDNTEFRIMDHACISRIGDQAWMEIVVPGMRIRFEMTLKEIEELRDVSTDIARQLREHLESNK